MQAQDTTRRCPGQGRQLRQTQDTYRRCLQARRQLWQTQDTYRRCLQARRQLWQALGADVAAQAQHLRGGHAAVGQAKLQLALCRRRLLALADTPHREEVNPWKKSRPF